MIVGWRCAVCGTTVDVAEPETDKAIAMLRSVAPIMEEHHNDVVHDEAVAAAVYDSARAAGVGTEIPTEWFLQDVRD